MGNEVVSFKQVSCEQTVLSCALCKDIGAMSKVLVK